MPVKVTEPATPSRSAWACRAACSPPPPMIIRPPIGHLRGGHGPDPQQPRSNPFSGDSPAHGHHLALAGQLRPGVGLGQEVGQGDAAGVRVVPGHHGPHFLGQLLGQQGKHVDPPVAPLEIRPQLGIKPMVVVQLGDLAHPGLPMAREQHRVLGCAWR